MASISDARAGAAGSGLAAALRGTGMLEASGRARVRVRGADRVRWLNGMVTNTVNDLAEGRHNYSFLLNAQGRIQGDAEVFAREGELVLEIDRAQQDRLVAHLDHFIIMDDVELEPMEGETALGLAGPRAAALLQNLDLPVPGAGEFAPANEGGVREVVGEWAPLVPRYTLWVEDEAGVRQRLLTAGAVALTTEETEALRVLEGTPRYGVDITDRHLPQETGVTRALHFSKGCYLGQEIVERIRSRAQVHRGIQQFVLEGEPARPGSPLMAGEAPAGELTSVAHVELPEFTGQVALGTVRLEYGERGEELRYSGEIGGGVARAIAGPLLDSAR